MLVSTLGPWNTWLISNWEKNNCCYKLSKCTKWQLFHSKWSKLSFRVKIVVMRNRWTPNFWSEKLKNYNQSSLKHRNESRILLTFLKKQMTVKETHLVKFFKICLLFVFLQIHWPSYTHSLSIRNALSRNDPLILDFLETKTHWIKKREK